jgi:hypothetical protein
MRCAGVLAVLALGDVACRTFSSDPPGGAADRQGDASDDRDSNELDAAAIDATPDSDATPDADRGSEFGCSGSYATASLATTPGTPFQPIPTTTSFTSLAEDGLPFGRFTVAVAQGADAAAQAQQYGLTLPANATRICLSARMRVLAALPASSGAAQVYEMVVITHDSTPADYGSAIVSISENGPFAESGYHVDPSTDVDTAPVPLTDSANWHVVRVELHRGTSSAWHTTISVDGQSVSDNPKAAAPDAAVGGGSLSFGARVFSPWKDAGIDAQVTVDYADVRVDVDLD